MNACTDCGIAISARAIRCKRCAAIKRWQHNSYREKKSGEGHPGWKGGKLQIGCKVCGKLFETRQWDIDRGNGKYCSRECMGADRKGHWTGPRSPRWRGGPISCVCEVCGIEFERCRFDVELYGGRFCSRQCACEAVDFSGSKNPNWRGGYLERQCEACGKTFSVPPGTKPGHGRFCSRQCANATIRHGGPDNPNWKGGLSFEPYGYEFNATLKQRIRERDEFTCQICGRLETETPHSVHHIDYNKEHNNADNLITLCKNCHSRTNYNRRYWQFTLRWAAAEQLPLLEAGDE
jgi:hypothetical protein